MARDEGAPDAKDESNFPEDQGSNSGDVFGSEVSGGGNAAVKRGPNRRNESDVEDSDVRSAASSDQQAQEGASDRSSYQQGDQALTPSSRQSSYDAGSGRGPKAPQFDPLKLAKCISSSFICGSRCSTAFFEDSEEKGLEKDYIYYVCASQAKGSTGPFTDVASFDRNDGVIVADEPALIQHGMVSFFMDEVRTYLAENNEIIPCQGNFSDLLVKVRHQMILMKKLKAAVDDLAGEIQNQARVSQSFIRLRKEVNLLAATFTRKFSILRAVEESVKNVWVNTSPTSLRHFLRTLAVDVLVIMDNVQFPDNWTTAQFFQVMCEEVMERARKMIAIEKVFSMKATDGFSQVTESTKLCLFWRRYCEFSKVTFEQKLDFPNCQTSKIFGSIMAFIRRCKSLKDICMSNSQLSISFCGSGKGPDREPDALPSPHLAQVTVDDNVMEQIWAEYSSRLSRVSRLRHRCLDIKDESLAAEFERFHNEMQAVDTMILSAIKLSFDQATYIKEKCEILDAFHSMSERSRVRATYHQMAANVSHTLSAELSRLKQKSGCALGYSRRLYSGFAVDLIRSQGMVQRSDALVEDVTVSNAFLDDFDKIQAVQKHREPLKANLRRKVREAFKMRDYLERMEVSFKSFLICRSAGFEGCLDVNINRDLPTSMFDVKLLESLGSNIIKARTSLFERHSLHRLNVTAVCRMVTEYNMMFTKLSDSERGIFRNKILALDRRVWNGIYRFIWQEQEAVLPWVGTCDEAVCSITRDILEYKRINASLQNIMSDAKRLSFVQIELDYQYEPDKFCKLQFQVVKRQVELIKARCQTIAQHLRSVQKLVDILPEDEEASGPAAAANNNNNQQWVAYKAAMGTFLGESLVLSLSRSLRSLAMALSSSDTWDSDNGGGSSGRKPIIKAGLVLSTDSTRVLLTVDTMTKDLCLFLDSFSRTVLDMIVTGVSDGDDHQGPNQQWHEALQDRLYRDHELAVLSSIIEEEVRRTYENLQRYLPTAYAALRDFWTIGKPAEQVLGDGYWASQDLANFSKDLAKLRQVVATAQDGLPKQKWINFLDLDATAANAEIRKRCASWHHKYCLLLARLAADRSGAAKQCLEELDRLIRAHEVQGREDVVDRLLDDIDSGTTQALQILTVLRRSALKNLHDGFTSSSASGISSSGGRERKTSPREDEARTLSQLMDELDADTMAIRDRFTVLKRDRRNILLQTRDMSGKATSEQMKRAKDVARTLEEMVQSFKVQAPYTSSWKCEEALAEIKSLKGRLQFLKSEAQEAKVQQLLQDGSADNVKWLEDSLEVLERIWGLALDWDVFERKTYEAKVGQLDVQAVEGDLARLSGLLDKFCASTFDGHIEIHLTIQARLKTFSSTLHVVEAFRSKAIKVRHWKHIAKICSSGLASSSSSSTTGDESFLPLEVSGETFNDLTLDEFMSLGLDRSTTDIKAIVEKAEKEFEVEKHLDLMRVRIGELAFKFRASPNNTLGIRVIANDGQLMANIDQILISLGECKNNNPAEATEPFRAEIEALELNLSQAARRIRLIKKVETSFGVLTDISSSYSLDVQLGKFQHKLAILGEFWKTLIHDGLSPTTMTTVKPDLEGDMDNWGGDLPEKKASDAQQGGEEGDLENNLLAVELETGKLEALISCFLATRRHVFPKFALCPEDKLKSIFSQTTTTGPSSLRSPVLPEEFQGYAWMSAAFPQVSRPTLAMQSQQQQQQQQPQGVSAGLPSTAGPPASASLRRVSASEVPSGGANRDPTGSAGTATRLGDTTSVKAPVPEEAFINGFYASSGSGLVRPLLTPVPINGDFTIDFSACKMLQSLRESFKEEIFQLFVSQKKASGTGPAAVAGAAVAGAAAVAGTAVAGAANASAATTSAAAGGGKQGSPFGVSPTAVISADLKQVLLTGSAQALFVARYLNFSLEMARLVNEEDKLAQKNRILDMLINQNARIDQLMGLGFFQFQRQQQQHGAGGGGDPAHATDYGTHGSSAEGAASPPPCPASRPPTRTEEVSKRYHNLLCVESVIQHKLEHYVQSFFDDSLREDILVRWHSAPKYGMTKDPFEVYVAVEDRQLPFNYDEAGGQSCEALMLLAFLGENEALKSHGRKDSLSQIFGAALNGQSSVLSGCPFAGKLSTLRCFSQFLGRQLIPISMDLHLESSGTSVVSVQHQASLQSLMFCLESSPDLVCVRGIKDQWQYGNVFSAFLAFRIKLKEFQACHWNTMVLGGGAVEPWSSQEVQLPKVYYLVDVDANAEAENPGKHRLMQRSYGSSHREVSVVPPRPNWLARLALHVEGFPVTLALNQALVIVTKLIEERGSRYQGVYPRCGGALSDMRMILRKAQEKVRNLNASAQEAIIGAIAEVMADAEGQRLIRDMVAKEAVRMDFSKLVAPSGGLRASPVVLSEEQASFCRDSDLVLTPSFASSLTRLQYAMDSGRQGQHVIIYGPAVSQKTALWRVAAHRKRNSTSAELVVVSSLAFECDGCPDHLRLLVALNRAFLADTASDEAGPKDLLLVVVGVLTRKMLNSVHALIDYNCYRFTTVQPLSSSAAKKGNGPDPASGSGATTGSRDLLQLIRRERNVQVLIETESVANLDPAVASFFKLHFRQNSDISWKMILRCEMRALVARLSRQSGSPLNFNGDPLGSVLASKAEEHIGYLLDCRRKLGLEDTSLRQYQQISSFVSFLSAILTDCNRQRGSDTKVEEAHRRRRDEAVVVQRLNNIVTYSALYNFSQDLSSQLKKRAEIMMRSMPELRKVSVEYSIFDYYYSCAEDAWRPYAKHPSLTAANVSMMAFVPHHVKQEIVARTLIENLMSVDICGGPGVGKTTLMSSILQYFNHQHNHQHHHQHHHKAASACNNYLGLSVPSSPGTSIGTIARCISSAMNKNSSSSSSTESGSSFKSQKCFILCLDDVSAWRPSVGSTTNEDGNHLCDFVKFLGKHRSWFLPESAGLVSYQNQVVVTSRELLPDQEPLFSGVRITLDAIERSDQVGIFKRALKDRFLVFELDIQFLVIKVIMASVDINRVFVGHPQLGTSATSSSNWQFFHIQDTAKVMAGICKTHKDCHDTRYELLQVWINELHHVYFEKLLLQGSASTAGCEVEPPALSVSAGEELTAEVKAILMHYFGQEAVDIFDSAPDTIIGNFLDSHQFYTTIEEAELKAFVTAKVAEMGSAARTPTIAETVVPCPNTIRLVSELLRVMEIGEGGHVLLFGSGVVSPAAVVRLVCGIRGDVRMLKLTACDIRSQQWKRKLRIVTKVCGLDKKPICLYVPASLVSASAALRASLETIVKVGYDLSLLKQEELEIMSQKQGYFLNIAENTRRHFHCVMYGPRHQDVSPYFSNEHLLAFSCGQYQDHLAGYTQELFPKHPCQLFQVGGSCDKDTSAAPAMVGAAGLETPETGGWPEAAACCSGTAGGTSSSDNLCKLDVFQDINRAAEGFFQSLPAEERMVPPDLSSYLTFVNIFKTKLGSSTKSFDEFLLKLNRLVTRILEHFCFSGEQLQNLDRMKDQLRATVQMHQKVSMDSVGTRKEIGEVEQLIGQLASEHSEEQSAMLRLNMAIVEERTCQWSLFQRYLRDLDDSVLDENDIQEFNQTAETNGCIAEYAKVFDQVCKEIDGGGHGHARGDEGASFGGLVVQLRYFLAAALEVYDSKAVSSLAEDERLQAAKDTLLADLGGTAFAMSGSGSSGGVGGSSSSPSGGGGSCAVLTALVRLHHKMISMAKSVKNVVTKEHKLQALQKKCQSIEEGLKAERKRKQGLQARFLEEVRKMDELQALVHKDTEVINGLEHLTTEHKNLKEPLQALLTFLRDVEDWSREEVRRLPGSLILGAAFASYCGSLRSARRRHLVESWKGVLGRHGIPFSDDVTCCMTEKGLRESLASSEATMIKENMALLGNLPSPILVIDPVQVALEYLETFHSRSTSSSLSMLHVGDPQLSDQFNHLRDTKNNNDLDDDSRQDGTVVVIIFHSVLDLEKFDSVIDLDKHSCAAKGGPLVIYHVAPSIVPSQARLIRPSQVVTFDFDVPDTHRYIYSRLRLIMPDKARILDQNLARGAAPGLLAPAGASSGAQPSGPSEHVGRSTEATLKDVIEGELQPFIDNPDLILDFNVISQSIEKIRKILASFRIKAKDQNGQETGTPDKGKGQQQQQPVSDLLRSYSKAVTTTFVGLGACYLRESVPISLQTFLSIAKKNLEVLGSLDKKDQTQDRIASVLVDTILRFYDTNVFVPDGVLLKTTLLFFLYLTSADEADPEASRLLEVALCQRDPFFRINTSTSTSSATATTPAASAVARAVAGILRSLASPGLGLFWREAVRLVEPVLPHKINCDRDLYRVYAKSSNRTPSILRVEAATLILEAMASFSKHFDLQDLVMVDISQDVVAPVRLLEGAVEKNAWMLVTGVGLWRTSGSDPDNMNLLDFLIKLLKTNKTVHEHFRLWIVCEDLHSITVSTAQKCICHYLKPSAVTADPWAFGPRRAPMPPSGPGSNAPEAPVAADNDYDEIASERWRMFNIRLKYLKDGGLMEPHSEETLSEESQKAKIIKSLKTLVKLVAFE